MYRQLLSNKQDPARAQPLDARASVTRCCVSNYYFSPESPEGHNYFHVTSFKARPEQPMARLWTSADSLMRNCLRHVVWRGFAKNDVYQTDTAGKHS